MTIPSASERPRLAVSADGSLVAVTEGSGIAIIELPHRKRAAEINIDPDAEGFDLGWVGSPPRLVVVSRFAEHTTVHLLDPSGPRTITEIQLESPVRLYATVGTHALVAGAQGTAILNASETHLTPYQFPARAVPAAACATTSRFMVAVPGAIEEWDPQSRMPKRRLRLPRPATITALGASDRVVWMTTQQDPNRIDVVPLVNRGQPKAHELAEPIAFAVGHPRSELVICLGAQTGKLYAVDLDGRSRHRVLAADGVERVDAAGLVVTRTLAVAIAQAGRPLALTSLEQRDADPAAPAVQLPWGEPSKPSSLVEELDSRGTPELPTDSLAAVTTSATIAAPWGARTPADAPLGFVAAATDAGDAHPDDAAPFGAWASPVAKPAPPAAPPTTAAARAFPASRGARPVMANAAPPVAVAAAAPARTAQDVSRRFSAWRERLKDGVPAEEPAAPKPAAPPPTPTPAIAASPIQPGWREALVAWTRALPERPAMLPDVPAIETLASRFELPREVVPALALLYGAHLSGEHGAAPVDVARVLGGAWDEALGRGALARHGLVVHARSRVRLADPIQQALDELPSRHVVVGDPAIPSTLLGPCGVIAADEPLAEIAARAVLQIGGGILASAPGAFDVDTLYLEARARGLVPLLALARLPQLRPEPAILVVERAELLEALQIPAL